MILHREVVAIDVPVVCLNDIRGQFFDIRTVKDRQKNPACNRSAVTLPVTDEPTLAGAGWRPGAVFRGSCAYGALVVAGSGRLISVRSRVVTSVVTRRVSDGQRQ